MQNINHAKENEHTGGKDKQKETVKEIKSNSNNIVSTNTNNGKDGEKVVQKNLERNSSPTEETIDPDSKSFEYYNQYDDTTNDNDYRNGGGLSLSDYQTTRSLDYSSSASSTTTDLNMGFLSPRNDDFAQLSIVSTTTTTCHPTIEERELGGAERWLNFNSMELKTNQVGCLSSLCSKFSVLYSQCPGFFSCCSKKNSNRQTMSCFSCLNFKRKSPSNIKGCLSLQLPHKFRRQDFVNGLGILIILMLIYSLMIFIFGQDNVLPIIQQTALSTDTELQQSSHFGNIGSVFFAWVASLTFGSLAKRINLPPLLGMLVSGLLLRNLLQQKKEEEEIPLIFELPPTWTAIVRASSLALILMRSGLEIDMDSLRHSTGFAHKTLRLTCIPGIVEAFCCGISACLLFKMSFFMGLSLGFILAAVSPAVVVVGMFDLHKRGYGVKKGIPSLVVAAASFDDIVAISGFSFCIGFGIHSLHMASTDNTENASSSGMNTNLILSILDGPLSLIFGVLLGSMGGLIISFTKVWNKHWKRSLVTFLLGMNFMFGMAAIHFPGSGALASIVMGMVGSYRWKKSSNPSTEMPQQNTIPTENTNNNSNFNLNHYADQVEKDFAKAWKILFEPLLFGVIGLSLDFSAIESNSTVPKSVAIIMIGLLVRLPAAFFSTYGGTGVNQLTLKERVFVALAWSPKATVQAALSSVPLELITNMISSSDPKYEIYIEWGNNILTTAVLSILITAPIGLLAIQLLGPMFLNCDFPRYNNTTKARNNNNKDRDIITRGLLEDQDDSYYDVSEMKNDILNSFRNSQNDKDINNDNNFIENGNGDLAGWEINSKDLSRAMSCLTELDNILIAMEEDKKKSRISSAHENSDTNTHTVNEKIEMQVEPSQTKSETKDSSDFGNIIYEFRQSIQSTKNRMDNIEKKSGSVSSLYSV